VNVTLQQLADLVQGKVVGDPATLIRAARSLDSADAGDITFVENDKSLPKLHTSKASAAVVAPTVPVNGKPLVQVADPLAAFIAIVQHLHGKPKPAPCGVDPRAAVHPTAKLGRDVSVLPFACIGENTVIGDRCTIHPGAVIGRDCKLGNDITIHPHAVLYDGTEIADRTIIHANAVIGADGFGYRFQGGKHVKVPQLGTVAIGADVEIGACTAIDRSTFDITRIGDGTKIDNLVQIGHNCRIGRHNILCAQVGIAGSSSTDDFVVLAGQVGVSDHIHIGAGAVLAAQAGVMRDIPPGQQYGGYPAAPVRDWLRSTAIVSQLPDLSRDVRKIKKSLGMAEKEKAA
jgi:UDP-3-O-[3-hydroxymyristoyl] glucosamine N-acyltransferase